MLIVTGGIACGKSTFLEVARQFGRCIDADDWYNDQYKSTGNYLKITDLLFGTRELHTVAFNHENWTLFQEIVFGKFWTLLEKEPFEIVAIPDFFSRTTARTGFSVLTIERPDNLGAALLRDPHRDPELTKKLHSNQMSGSQREQLADYVLFNNGTKEQFEKECENWLKLHLLEVSIPYTKVINM